MVHSGARGATEEEIARVFHFGSSQDSLDAAFGELQRSLDRGASLGGYQLSLANRLWGQSGEPFRQGFLDVTRVHYGAEMEIEDFVRDPGAVRVDINDWVAGADPRTDGRLAGS